MATELGYDTPDEAGRAALASILGDAFGFPASEADGWFATAGHDNVRVVRDARGVLGGLLLVPMGQGIGGRVLPMMGIAGVGVAAHARRAGVATALMRSVLGEARERGFAISTLYASNQPLYRSVGYEPAGSRFVGEVLARDLPRHRTTHAVRPLVDADQAAEEALYDEVAGARSGWLARGPYVWTRTRRFRDGTPSASLGWFDDTGALRGLLRWRTVREPSDDRHLIQVTDLLAPEPDTLRAVVSALADMGTMATRIRLATAPTDPTYLLLPHPFLTMRLFENWMVRVVDLPRALTGRGYPAGRSGAVDLDVEDPLGLCGGRHRLEVHDGQARVEPGGSGAVRVRVHGLAPLLTGFLHPREARVLGLFESDDASLDRLGELLAAPSPWMPDMF